jgi:Ran GTPase-activating protein (RanGAP) involved in mRNA processing and transport
MPPITLERKERIGRGEEYLSGARVENLSVKDLEALKSHEYQALESLDLSQNDLTKKGLAVALSRLFTVNYGLKELNLSGCKLGELSPDEFKLIFEKLQERKGLQALDLSGNGISNIAQEQILAQFVTVNPVRRIDLSDNGMEYFGLVAILGALSEAKLPAGQKFEVDLAGNPDISESQRAELAKQYKLMDLKFEREPEAVREASRVATIRSHHNLQQESGKGKDKKNQGASASNG